jgi:hypothetical protein
MLSSVLDALVGQVPFVPVITVLDALWAVLILWWAGSTVTEAVRVRDGSISRKMVLWPSKKGVKGTHGEFVARYRRRLTVTGRSFVALGASNLVFATVGVLDGESDEFALLLLALPLLAWGVVSLRCRGILDSPRPAPALGFDREAASG